jgi:hypothetical protein
MNIRTRPAAVPALLGLALAGLMLAGCSASKSTSSEPAAAPAGGPANAQRDSALDGGKAAGGTDAVPPAPTAGGGQNSPQLAPQLRSLIYTGTIQVTVPDVVKAADAATTAATAAGGNVAGDNRTLDADRSEAQLTLRVPSDAFSSTMDKLARLGAETSRSVTTQDVTEDLVDLDARLATQQASVDRVRALLAKANTVGEVVSIESELTKREADLDSLEQRRTKLSGLVALSTITLNLRGTEAPLPTPVAADSGFLAGLKSGWHGFVSSAKVFLTVAGWLLPWLLVIGIPAWLILRFVRRRRPAPVLLEPAPAATFTAPPPAGGIDPD